MWEQKHIEFFSTFFRWTSCPNPIRLHSMVRACPYAKWSMRGSWLCASHIWSTFTWHSRCIWGYSPVFNCLPPPCCAGLQSQEHLLCQCFLTMEASLKLPWKLLVSIHLSMNPEAHARCVAYTHACVTQLTHRSSEQRPCIIVTVTVA